MHTTLAIVLGGLAVVVVLNLVARRSGVPAAVLLVLAGLAYAWLPGPNVELRPALVLDVVIPPLLYGAALNSSAVGLRRNVRTVVSLSVGLVLATALVVGAATSALVPGLPLAAAVALGAAVAPPDPVASLGIGRRVGLPPRLITIVEGEGLLNDAAALTLLQVAVASAVGGGFSVLYSAGRFALAAAGGLVAGLAVAAAYGFVRRHLEEPLADNAVSLTIPYAAYLLAGSFGGSGVLAVVIAGLWFAHSSPTVLSGPSRLQSRAVWTLIEYLLEGFVFLLIGQQLPTVLAGLRDYTPGTVAVATVVTVGAVLLVRPVWLLLSERAPARLHTRLGDDDPATAGHDHLTGRAIVALSWSGTRGVITLAAAFSLPVAVASGRPFPARDLLLFCAYVVVLVTLVGQGLTFGFVLRRLRLGSSEGAQALVRNEARAAAVRAALDRLDELVREEQLSRELTDPLRASVQRRLDRYTSRIDRLSNVEDGVLPPDDPYFVAVRLRRELIDTQRAELLHWRDTGRLPDESLRKLLRELDHEEYLLPRGAT